MGVLYDYNLIMARAGKLSKRQPMVPSLLLLHLEEQVISLELLKARKVYVLPYPIDHLFHYLTSCLIEMQKANLAAEGIIPAGCQTYWGFPPSLWLGFVFDIRLLMLGSYK